MPREADLLRSLAEEESAKALILIDLVRCPKAIVNSRIGRSLHWFYDRLARLIYLIPYEFHRSGESIPLIRTVRFPALGSSQLSEDPRASLS